MAALDLDARSDEAVPSAVVPRLKNLHGCVPCLEKLDRLGWTAGISFVSHGARIGVRVNDPAALDEVRERLPPGARISASPAVDDLYSLFIARCGGRSKVRRYDLLYQQWSLLARSLERQDLLDVLESTLHFNVAVRARRRLFVHAGVVGWRGRAIVVAGHSMSGKTELVHALVRAGADYYSDEYAVLDARGRVHPYAKPLSLREEGRERRRRCRVESFGGRCGNGPLPVGLVALAEYREGARWRPRALSPGEAVLALLGHTLLARVRPELALRTLQKAVPDAVTLRGKRGEAEATARALLDVLDGRGNDFKNGRSHIMPALAPVGAH